MEQKAVTLSLEALAKLRNVDGRLVSYNIEMAEVTGGTFWKTYTPGQIAGTEEFSYTGGAGSFESTEESEELMEVCPPINLYNEKLRYLAKELGPVWVRVAGGWANRTYYDFDGHTGGVVPEGYLNILTKEQWTGVLDFVKAVHGKLLISCANCDGLHKAEEPWNPSQAEIIFSFSKEYGVPIDAVEFTNEPNAMDAAGMPKGYTPAFYRRDHDLFFSWLKAHYPDVLRVGPCTLGGDVKLVAMVNLPPNGGTVYEVPCCKTEELLNGTKEPLDVFSCHYYNGVSERIEKQMPGGHWHAD